MIFKLPLTSPGPEFHLCYICSVTDPSHFIASHVIDVFLKPQLQESCDYGSISALKTKQKQLALNPKSHHVRAIGGSIQLNCSLDCPDGKPQWKGLDTNLGNIISTPTYSLLLVTNAAVAMEGMKFCMGNSCRSSCAILFSALPDTLQLETQPRELVAGQPAHLHCSISKVYPPGSLTLSWYRGDQRLESPDPEEAADDEELFSYDSELEVPGEKVTEGMEFRCEVELLLPSDRSFHRATAVAVSTKGKSWRAELGILARWVCKFSCQSHFPLSLAILVCRGPRYSSPESSC
uniref:Ig-like domain-containing protein n=1 Tax=Gopherus evgoodei TaxID=1825980 RepID=A0A8C4VT43_9SAUR